MNNETRQRDSEKDRTNTGSRPAHPSTTTKPHGEVRHGYGAQAEQESSRGIQLEDILSPENLSLAWTAAAALAAPPFAKPYCRSSQRGDKQVRANKGAAGCDGMEVGDFPDFYAKHWETIHRKLIEGSYSPSPVRRVQIPKGKGEYRSLGIPTVLDRLIQQAIAQALTPQYEAVFSDRSYGFRPRRSAHHAIAQMHAEALVKGKKCHVVD